MSSKILEEEKYHKLLLNDWKRDPDTTVVTGEPIIEATDRYYDVLVVHVNAAARKLHKNKECICSSMEWEELAKADWFAGKPKTCILGQFLTVISYQFEDILQGDEYEYDAEMDEEPMTFKTNHMKTRI